MREVLLVAAGGAIGSVLRYLVSIGFASRAGVDFPWHTFAVNALGAFLLGLLAAVVTERSLFPRDLTVLLGTGLLGGFTTFSALSYETMVLLERGRMIAGSVNLLGSAVVGVAAAWVGLVVGRSI